MEKFKYLLQSRKFWAAVIGLVFIVVKAYVPNIPITEEQAVSAVGIIAAYIIGTGLDSRPPAGN